MNKSLESGWNASVTAEAKAGFAGASVGVSGKYGQSGNDKRSKARDHSVASEISSSASVGTTTKHTTTCTPEEGEPGAGLWQWVISTEDYSTTALTAHTICRTGSNAFEAPACAFWDCLDA